MIRRSKFYPRLLAVLMVLSLSVLGYARETVFAVRGPGNHAALGGVLELLDDVYSADLNFSGEFAPCNCFSVYGDVSYRLVSYEFDTMLHDQRHEALDLKVSGFNESYVGMKFMPYSFFGIDVNWRLPPGDGSQVNRFHRLGVAPMGLYDFSKTLKLGVAAEYFTFLEKDSFLPGDELGVRTSLTWNLFWDMDDRSGWEVSHVFLYRWRISESENLNMDEEFRKMGDLYRGFRMRSDVARYFALGRHSLGVALFYEMNRGNLFGFETGHALGLYGNLRW